MMVRDSEMSPSRELVKPIGKGISQSSIELRFEATLPDSSILSANIATPKPVDKSSSS
jgi:hypothetical protein